MNGLKIADFAKTLDPIPTRLYCGLSAVWCLFCSFTAVPQPQYNATWIESPNWLWLKPSIYSCENGRIATKWLYRNNTLFSKRNAKWIRLFFLYTRVKVMCPMFNMTWTTCFLSWQGWWLSSTYMTLTLNPKNDKWIHFAFVLERSVCIILVACHQVPPSYMKASDFNQFNETNYHPLFGANGVMSLNLNRKCDTSPRWKCETSPYGRFCTPPNGK